MKSRFRAICVLLSGIELNWEREGGCGMVVCVVAQRSWLNLARFLTGVFFFQYGVVNELCVVFGPVMKRNDVARLAEWVERKMSG